MSSSHHAHVHVARHSPPNVRKATVKALRSAHSSRTLVAPNITIKLAKGTKHPKDLDEDTFQDDEDDDMASSFLQFCAMCEKQIVVPNSSILYCSESCRRRDSVAPATNPYLNLASPTKMVPSAYCDDMDGPFGSKIPTYVAAMQPTPRPTQDARIPPPMAHDGKSDLDPTEWKPAETTLMESKSPPGAKAVEWKPKLPHHPSSEAFAYLSKFHRSSDSLYSKRRPTLGHGRSTISSRTTPSLSHTPTASTSSEESLSGTPYEFVARPALSVPTTTTSRCTEGGKLAQAEDDDLTYEKKFVGTSLGSAATGSLKKLLRTGEM